MCHIIAQRETPGPSTFIDRHERPRAVQRHNKWKPRRLDADSERIWKMTLARSGRVRAVAGKR
jgi:hypothetical protein